DLLQVAPTRLLPIRHAFVLSEPKPRRARIALFRYGRSGGRRSPAYRSRTAATRPLSSFGFRQFLLRAKQPLPRTAPIALPLQRGKWCLALACISDRALLPIRTVHS